MSDPNRERPCIHISLVAGADAALVRTLEAGAEEEGVPCRVVASHVQGVVALAYEAALSSRFGIGLGLDQDEIVLHELHMPAEQPVLRFGLGAGAGAACRAMGANAARLLVHRPLHLSPLLEVAGDATPASVGSAVRSPVAARQLVAPGAPVGNIDVEAAALARIVAAVVEKLRERGIR